MSRYLRYSHGQADTINSMNQEVDTLADFRQAKRARRCGATPMSEPYTAYMYGGVAGYVLDDVFSFCHLPATFGL